MHEAVKNGNAAICQLLPSHANSRCLDYIRRSSTSIINHAAQYGYVDVMRVLLDHGADFNTPSAFNGHSKTVSYLLLERMGNKK